MNIIWQDLIAVGIVTAAVAYLGRTVYRMLFGGKSGCGGCGSCPADAGKTPPLVSLELSSGRAPRSSSTSSGPGDDH